MHTSFTSFATEQKATGRIDLTYKLPRKQISSFNELPVWIQKSCFPIAQYFNPLQFKIASDIILDNDLIITVPNIQFASPGIILGSIYKLFTSQPHKYVMIIFIVFDINSPVVDMCIKLSKTHHFNIFIQDIPEPYSKSIIICTPDKSAEFIQQVDVTYHSIDILEHVAVFNCEELLTDHWSKMKNNFMWIPSNIKCSFISTSSCKDGLNKLKQLIDLNGSSTKKYELYKYDNLKHWVVHFDCNRLDKLLECIKNNKYNQGIIFCSVSNQHLIHSKLKHNSYKSVIYKEHLCGLISEYNSAKLQYIIVSDENLFNLKCMCLNLNNIKVIINYDIDCSVRIVDLNNQKRCYLRRATIAPYLAENKKVHIISLIDKSNMSSKLEIEFDYNVILKEIHSNISNVFVDEQIRFDFNKLKHIEQAIQDLVYGYIRQTTNRLNSQTYFPQSIMFMCLFFHYDELYGPVVWNTNKLILQECQKEQHVFNPIMKNTNKSIWLDCQKDAATKKEQQQVFKPIVGKHKKQMIPTLKNVILNKNLLMNQVPILKKKDNTKKMNANYLWLMEHDFKHWITTVPYDIKLCVFGYVRHLQSLFSNKNYYNIDLFIIDIIIKYYYQLKVPMFLNGDETERTYKKIKQ